MSSNTFLDNLNGIIAQSGIQLDVAVSSDGKVQ
jgi:hypothetical protein